METDYQAIVAEPQEPVGYHATERRASLDGVLVTDPVQAQALATAAGIGQDPLLRSAGWPG